MTQARAAAMQARAPRRPAQAEGQLTAALGGLRVVAEQYPELRATENFQQLQRQLSELEDEIQASRRIYNSNVQAYNTRIQQFPDSIIANQGGFTAQEFFEIDGRRRARGPAGLLLQGQPPSRLATLEASRPEAALAASRVVERVGLQRAGGGDRDQQQLRDPVARRDLEVERLVGVQQQHPHLAAVARIDQARAS